MCQLNEIFVERLDDKPLTSSWPKELKLQEIQSKEDELTEDDYDEDDDDYFEYDDDEDEYDEEEDEYDDDYYDEEFYENNEVRIQDPKVREKPQLLLMMMVLAGTLGILD